MLYLAGIHGGGAKADELVGRPEGSLTNFALKLPSGQGEKAQA